MNIESLGHVVLKVSDLENSKAFYNGLLGLPISAESTDWKMVFFTLGDHHNFAILEIGPGPGVPDEGIGVDHFAFKLEGGIGALRQAARELSDADVKAFAVDHNVSYSLYFTDPDGNRLEVYVDGVTGWEDDDSIILTQSKPLDLSADA